MFGKAYYMIYACIAFFLFISQSLCYDKDKGFQQNILLMDTIFIMNQKFFRWSYFTNVEMVTVTWFRNTGCAGSIVCKTLCDIFLAHK